MEYILRTNTVSKKYTNYYAVDKVSISIKKGEIYGLIGENGAGKSTLMKMIAGLVEPSEGSIELFGNFVPQTERYRIGCVIESPALYAELTAKQNLEVFRKAYGLSSKESVQQILKQVGLSQYENKIVKKFSLGMKQRLAIGVALLGNPDFLILDEPINGLDPTGIQDMRNFLLKLNREEHITIMISSHILGELSKIATKYGIIKNGKLIEEITAKYLFQTLQIEKIELGEAVSGEGNMTVDLQDTYMQNAKILLVSGENIEDFHVAGQCESLNMLQGNKFAVAELENPLERQITMDYSLENRGNVHTYLIKEYFLKADMEKSYTSEEGTFTLKVNVVNHQEKPVLDSETLKDSISVLINGKEASYRVENGTAMVPYQTDETAKVNVEIAIQPSGNVVHYIKTADTVELTVPVVEEEPDYTVLWIVIISLCAVVLLLSVLYERKKQKKTMVRRVPLS